MFIIGLYEVDNSFVLLLILMIIKDIGFNLSQ